MGCVILSIFTTRITVVIFDQVFKDGGVKIEFFGKDALEAEVDQLVDDGAAESITLGFIGNIFTHAIKQHHLGTTVGLDCEYVVVVLGNVAQCVVEQLGKVWRVLLTKEIADKVMGF